MRTTCFVLLLLVQPVTLLAQRDTTSTFAQFRAAMERLPRTPFRPASLEGYVLVWSSFNEGTLEDNTKPKRVTEHITLKEKLAELERHRDAPGMEYPIIYSYVWFYGDRYAYVNTDWMTNVPRGEDLYFERRP